MDYVFTVFDLVCLLFVLLTGILVLVRARNDTERLLGAAVLVQALGDASRVIPEVLTRFSSGETMPAFLGIGRFVSGLTLTVFLLLLYKAWHGYYGEPEYHRLSRILYALAFLRLVLFLLPQNGWLQNEAPILWTILRNIPLLALWAVVVRNYFTDRWRSSRFSLVWLLLLLTVVFCFPADLLSGHPIPYGVLTALGEACRAGLAWFLFGAVTKDEPYARRRKDA